MRRRRDPRSLLVLGLLACSGAAVLGCSAGDGQGGAKAALDASTDAAVAYAEALQAVRDRDWETAKTLLQELKGRFPYSKEARQAELRLADIAFEEGKFVEAIGAYREYTQAHRSDRDLEYARFRITKALHLDSEDSRLMAPQEERDQASILETWQDLRAFVREFPRSAYGDEVRYMLEVATQRLVRHDLYVARYYVREGRLEAAVARIHHALSSYPGSALEAEAMVLEGEALLQLHRSDEAAALFQRVIAEHPGPFAVPASRYLDELRSQGKLASGPGRPPVAGPAGQLVPGFP